METKRLVIAAGLSILVLVVWSYFAPKPPQQNKAPGQVTTPTSSSPAAAPSGPITASAPSGATRTSPAALLPVTGTKEQLVVVDRPLYRAVFSNKGAVLTSFVLRNYKDDSGNPLDVVHREPGLHRLPLSLDFGQDTAATRLANGELYRVEQKTEGRDEVVTFDFSDGTRSLEKEFRFGNGYLFSAHVTTAGIATPFLFTVGPGLRNLSAAEKGNRFTNFSGTVYFDGSSADYKERTKVKNTEEGKFPQGGYLGLEDNYFLAVFIPDQAFDWKVEPVSPDAQAKDNLLIAGPVGAGSLSTQIFLGPKDLSILTPLGLHLEETISFKDMGINWAFLAKPLIWLLKTTQRHVVSNWGWVIILVTIALRLVMFPLTQKSYKGMKRMQKLQPKIKAIQNKYKGSGRDRTTREKMNKEMMALYQAEGYNPMSGCWPMLMQAPIFFAFWVVLEKAIFLRHAPFIFWIHDLSAKDPTYLLVILMMLSMFGQTMLMPASTGAPGQTKMIAILMPLFWGFFMKDLPAGLVLYWFVSNMFTVGQQLLINRIYKEQPAPVPARARVRKARTGG